MSATRILTFGPFRLDLDAERLWRGTQAVPLTAKVFAVLCYLVEHSGQLVPRDTLLEAVWGTVYVSDAALASCIRDIRRALGDQGQQPQYVETVRGRGYRFLVSVTDLPISSASLTSPPRPPPAFHRPALLVGREIELSRLHQRLADALQGARQFVFLTGEAGIGKTTLVDTFVTQIASTEEVWLGRGQCIEQYGAGEAYLPLLEILGRLGRSPNGASLVAVLQQHAPSWLVQMPALVSAAEFDALQRRAGGTTQERMLRELAEVVETLTAERPLVLVLEDLHWCDVSTLDWLAYVAQRREPARLLVLGTYRPVEALVRAHPVRTVTQVLQVHGQCTELPLEYFSAADIAAYLAHRCVGALLPTALSDILHQRTNGNPLFLVTWVDELVQQGVLREEATGWCLIGGLEAAATGIPETLRKLLERQLAQLTMEEQMLLEAASVVGAEFAVAAVAAVVERPVDEVETRCAALALRGQVLRVCGTDEWPDGTVAARYGFCHDLYRETLYARIPVGRRVRWHRQIGTRLEGGYGPRVREFAAEVAEHFMRGRDAARAVPYLQYAGEQAVQRSAHQEAIVHFTHALELLQRLPDTAERATQELQVRMALGPALMTRRGYADPDVAHTYTRARELYQRVGEASQLFPVLWGLWQFANGSAQHRSAQELGEQLLTVAQQNRDPVHLLQSHHALWTTAFNSGDFPVALQHAEHGMDLYTPQHHHTHVLLYGVDDPGVCCRSFAAQTLWFLGYPEQATQRSVEALALAQDLAHPFSLAHTLSKIALVQQLRRDVPATHERAEAVLTLGTEHGFPYMVAVGTMLRGWVLAMQAQGAEGIATLRQARATLRTTGTEHWQPWCCAALAEAYRAMGQTDDGLAILAEALAIVEVTGERMLAAELYRLQGELLLQQASPDVRQAETCLHHALAIARRQQAKSLELRAVMSLSRLWQQHGKRDEACELLTPVYGWFAEGFDTADLQEAKALLAALV